MHEGRSAIGAVKADGALDASPAVAHEGDGREQVQDDQEAVPDAARDHQRSDEGDHRQDADNPNGEDG